MFNLFTKEKTTKIRFHFDQNDGKKRMTWKYLKMWRRLRQGTDSKAYEKDYVYEDDLQLFTARFMVDENNQYFDTQKAIRILDELDQDEIMDAFNRFSLAMQEALLPNPNGSGSSLLSEAGQVETLPIGLQR